MAEPRRVSSQRFTKAARAERDRLARQRVRLAKRRGGFQAKVDSLDQELEAVGQEISRLDDLTGTLASAESTRAPERDDLALSGSAIREVAVLLLIRDFGLGPIHYRDWLSMVEAEGHAVAGKRPEAVFLGQVSRSPLVTASRPGYYELNLDAEFDLRNEREAVMFEVEDLADGASAEERLDRTRDLANKLNRTERLLAEVERALRAAGPEAKALRDRQPQILM